MVFKQKIKINTNNSTTKKSLELSASKLLQASTCTFYHSQASKKSILSLRAERYLRICECNKSKKIKSKYQREQ